MPPPGKGLDEGKRGSYFGSKWSNRFVRNHEGKLEILMLQMESGSGKNEDKYDEHLAQGSRSELKGIS